VHHYEIRSDLSSDLNDDCAGDSLSQQSLRAGELGGEFLRLCSALRAHLLQDVGQCDGSYLARQIGDGRDAEIHHVQKSHLRSEHLAQRHRPSHRRLSAGGKVSRRQDTRDLY
jgi:hypothetical protein